MKSSLTTLAIVMLLATTARGDIKHYGTSGQTLYARVQTGPTSFVACALTEGAHSGMDFSAAGVYTATDAALVTAGLNDENASGYPFTIRSGSPSETANDPIVGYGQIAWSGFVEVPIAVNVTRISGGGIAADNAEHFFDGTGWGPMLFAGVISEVIDTTHLEILTPVGGIEDGSLDGLTIVLREGADFSLRTIVASDRIGSPSSDTVRVTIDSEATFDVTNSSTYEILPASFNPADRTVATAIKTKTDFLPSFTAGSAGGLFIAGPNAATLITGGLTANITGNLSGSVGSVSGLTITSGRVNADVTHWLGDPVVTPNQEGIPAVDVTHVLGSPVCD